MLSLVAPSVFAGVFIVGIASLAICNLDIFLERMGREMAETQRVPSINIKLSTNYCFIGLAMTIIFVGVGFFWGLDPSAYDRGGKIICSCLSVSAHFCALLAFVASMHKLVELVDLD